MNTEPLNQNQPENYIEMSTQLSNSEMQNIYNQLSVSENSLFDVIEENKYMQDCIEECFAKTFLQILSDDLQSNQILINNNLVRLIKFCLVKSNFKKIGIIFIGFCDYFDLNYNKTYLLLHEKLQLLIKNSAICLCGKEKYERKKLQNQTPNDKLHIVTLFDLVNNKK